MSKIDISIIYGAIRKYAETVGEVKKDADLAEVCDFGDSYGFIFDSDDRYSNVYYCVDKKSYKIYVARPNQIVDKFKKRKIIQINTVMRK